MSRFRVLNPGGIASLEVTLQRGRSVKAESDAMITKSADMEVSGYLEGGLLSSFFRALTGNSSFFFQTLTSARDDENAILAPKLVGDISLLQLGSASASASASGSSSVPSLSTRGYILQSGSFLACDESVQMSTQVQPDVVKGMFSGMNFFFLRASGSGCLAVSSVGAIHRFSLAAGEVRYVDNGHVVAFDSDLRYEVVKAARNVWSSAVSGEGLMCRFIGPGEVYVQTHSKESFSQRQGKAGSRAQGTPVQEFAKCSAFFCLMFVVFFIFVAGTLIINGAMQQGAFFNVNTPASPTMFHNRIDGALDGHMHMNGHDFEGGGGGGGSGSGGSKEYYKNNQKVPPRRGAAGWNRGE